MKRLGKILAVLAGLVLLVVLVGWMVPQSHVATRAARYRQPPEAVWEAITNFEAMPAWRTELERVERLPDRDGRPAWVEYSAEGRLAIEVVEWEPPRRMVGRIADPELPFGGTWTYEVTPVEGGAELRLTERGEIYNPLFRFMARFVFGYAKTMENYLTALGRKFGEEVTIIE